MELSKKTNMYIMLATLALACAPFLIAGCVDNTDPE